MKVIADLHMHSRYSRACSKDLTLPNIAAWADKKGITVIGTGDFTHPKWLVEIKELLEETKPGLYQLRDRSARAYFMLTAEVSSIYKQGDKVRRIHNLLLAPNIEAVEKLIAALEQRGANLKADGRPIMGIHAQDLVKMCKEIDSRIEIIPAHAWTPHFGVFGSLSGFDSLEEAFGDQAKHIFAIETGLSSDPKMNWEVSSLDSISLISNSDAHSLPKIGREVNIFEIDEAGLSYDTIISTIKNKDPKTFVYTVEFFPEEGKYHLDGHRDCKISFMPEETKKRNGICPVCGKKLLLGVLHRVADVGDRDFGYTPPGAVPFKSMIPLEEIIAEALDAGVSSKKVKALYDTMLDQAPEFKILLDLSEEQIAAISNPVIAQSIIRVRDGRVYIEPGYDGVFGKIQIYTSKEREQISKKPKQSSLF
jgi:uncharacterized protein (TIGR00375 family)